MNADRAVELREQAWNLQVQGKLDEAATVVREALLILEESGEANSPDGANLLNDLTEIENERQSFQDALVLAERAQSIEDQLGDVFAGKGRAQIRARTMGLIGETCRMLGDFVRAEASLKEALRIVATEFGEASECVAYARNNLAVLYKACGRFDEGLRLYQQALDSVVKLHGDDCLAGSVIYHNIGGILIPREISRPPHLRDEKLGRFFADCLAKTTLGPCSTLSPTRRSSTACKDMTKARPSIEERW